MSITTHLLKHPLTQSVLCFVGALAIRFVYLANRHEWVVPEASKPYLYDGRQHILAFWHGRLMMMPYFKPRKRQTHVLISGHKDGVIISKIISWFGIHTVTGSSSKGGMAAFKAMLRIARRGDNLCITPDGPRGPRQCAAPGIVRTAKHTGLPIIPVTFSATRHRRFSSWDRFMAAHLFGRICFISGTPIHVEKQSDGEALENKRLEVETSLNALTDEADRRCGVALAPPSGL